MLFRGEQEAISLTHRPWNITASTPDAIANYSCWALFSHRFWHSWWVLSLFQWLSTISKSISSILLIVGRLYIRISPTTRENTLFVGDGEGFMRVAMLLHVLMFWGLLAREGGRSDWPAENYPVCTSRLLRKAGTARHRLVEKLGNGLEFLHADVSWPPTELTRLLLRSGDFPPHWAPIWLTETGNLYIK